MTNQQGSKPNLPTSHSPRRHRNQLLWLYHVLVMSHCFLDPFRIFFPWRRSLSPQKEGCVAKNGQEQDDRKASQWCFWLGGVWEGRLGSPRQDDRQSNCVLLELLLPWASTLCGNPELNKKVNPFNDSPRAEWGEKDSEERAQCPSPREFQVSRWGDRYWTNNYTGKQRINCNFENASQKHRVL